MRQNHDWSGAIYRYLYRMDFTHALLRIWRRISVRGDQVSRTQVKVAPVDFEIFLRKRLGLSKRYVDKNSFKGSVVATLCLWQAGTLSHAAATQILTGLPVASKITFEELMRLSRVSLAVGLFRASLHFMEQSWSRMDSLVGQKKSAVFHLYQVRQLIYRGRIAEAKIEFDSLTRSARHSVSESQAKQLGLYFSWTLSSSHAEREMLRAKTDRQGWRDFVRNRDIVIVGPGVVTELPKLNQGFRVVRILGPGVFKWDDPEDICENRTDAVYTTPENVSADKLQAKPILSEVLSQYSFVNVKRHDTIGTRNSRAVSNFSFLFEFGHPFMVPLAILDILFHGGRPVVLGSDFFQCGVAYRTTERRKKHQRFHAESGSEGGAFDRSALMASHNIFENWSLIKNLANAGLVRGDRSFTRSIELTWKELFATYDEVIGVNRL